MVWDTLVMKTQSSMKILLVFATIAIYLVNNIQCIQIQNQQQPTSYSSSNVQTQYRQIDNYIKSNVVPQPQLVQNDQQINSYQSTGDSHYQIAPSNNNYYHDINNAQTKLQNTFNNQQPQSFYVNVDKPLPPVQEQPQGPTSDNHHFVFRQENENILANNVPTTQYTHQIEAPQQIQHYSEQIQQAPRSQIIQPGSDLIPAQQRTIPVEQYQQYTIQNQPESEPNHVVYQPQPDPYSLPQTQLQAQPQPQPQSQPQPQLQLQPQPQPEEIYQHQLPQNIPQQYNYEQIQEKPSQNANYPAYQQVLVNNEAPPKPKQSSGYKVRESPVERQTEEYSPTSDPFAGQQIVRNSQLFHDLAVHGSFNNDGSVFGQLQYPNQQISRGPTQQLSQNTYDVFSDSIQGQQHAGLSAYSSDGTPQQRLLNSGL